MSSQKKLRFINFLIMYSALCLSAAASAEWHGGVGTGPAFMNITGDQGWQTPASTPGGSRSVLVPLDYNPQDINDMLESAIGFGGFASNGVWLIQYSYGSMELEQTFNSKPGPITGSVLAGSSNFTASGAEVTAGYGVYRSAALRVYADAGIRYNKQEFDNRLQSSGALVFNISNNFSEEWTDALLGVTINVPFAKQFSWNTRANVGTGGSDETYTASTAVVWSFADHWATGVSVKYTKVDYENDSKGDSDWYLYNAEETSGSINLTYKW